MITKNKIVKMSLFPSDKVFVIAEMANSHEGSFLSAKQIVQYAYEAKADAIKFQKFCADELVERNHENFALFKKLEMNEKRWIELIKFAKQKHLKVFVDVFGIKSAKFISTLGVDGYKIHTSDMNNPEMLRFLGKSNKPVLVSAAGSFPNEIDESLKILLEKPKEIVLMHGFQGYPTKLEDLNLLRIKELEKKYCLPVGFMDHVSGDSEMALIAPLLAISLGAKVIEKHITLDRSKKGTDYYSALNPNEFKKLVSLIKMTKQSLGLDQLVLSKNEKKYRLSHRKNILARRSIKKGEILNNSMFIFKRTKQKQESASFFDLENRIASKNIKPREIMSYSMIDKDSPKVIAVIACRVDSSRLYAKPLQLIGEYPILHMLLAQIKKSNFISDVVLAISENSGNEVFVRFAKKHKLKFIIGDDKDVLQRLIQGAKYVNGNIVFRVTSENPFIYWEGIDALIKKHVKGNYDFSFFERLPIGAGFELINTKALEISHSLGNSRHRSELCSLYINEHQKKFKIQKIKTAINAPDLRLTVDNPQDLMVVRLIHESLGNEDKPIPLKKIIEFLYLHPEIRNINSSIPIGKTRIW